MGLRTVTVGSMVVDLDADLVKKISTISNNFGGHALLDFANDGSFVANFKIPTASDGFIDTPVYKMLVRNGYKSNKYSTEFLEEDLSADLKTPDTGTAVLAKRYANLRFLDKDISRILESEVLAAR